MSSVVGSHNIYAFEMLLLSGMPIYKHHSTCSPPQYVVSLYSSDIAGAAVRGGGAEMKDQYNTRFAAKLDNNHTLKGKDSPDV